MSQIFLAIFTIASAVLTVFAAAAKSMRSGKGLAGLLYGLDLCIAEFPGQVAFFMFSVTAAMAAGIIASFNHIASQWIISLDILFMLSAFILVKYHRLKLHPSASM